MGLKRSGKKYRSCLAALNSLMLSFSFFQLFFSLCQGLGPYNTKKGLGQGNWDIAKW
jgi:hypothetical protein